MDMSNPANNPLSTPDPSDAGAGATGCGSAASMSGSARPRNNREEIDRVETDILNAVDACGYPPASRFALRVALEEAMVNAFLHGHRGLSESVPIEVQYAVSPAEVEVRVTDQGPGFDPGAIADPTSDENLELPSGRGLMLIRAYMTSVEYEMHGRRIVMKYTRP